MPRPTPIVHTRVTPDNIQRFADQIVNILRALQEKRLLDYAIVEGVALDSTKQIDVQHGLGRAYRGWVVIRNTRGLPPFEVQNSRGSTHLTLGLNAIGATTTTTVSLLIF